MSIINLKTRKLFFNSYIKPHIDYASTVWDSCSEANLKRITSLHKRAVKVINLIPCLTCDERLEATGLLPLKKRLLTNKCVLMHKALNGKTTYLSKLFRQGTKVYSTSRNSLPIERPRNLFKSSLSYSGAYLWNSLPSHLQLTKSLPLFRKRVFELCQRHKFLIHSIFYSLFTLVCLFKLRTSNCTVTPSAISALCVCVRVSSYVLVGVGGRVCMYVCVLTLI